MEIFGMNLSIVLWFTSVTGRVAFNSGNRRDRHIVAFRKFVSSSGAQAARSHAATPNLSPGISLFQVIMAPDEGIYRKREERLATRWSLGYIFTQV